MRVADATASVDGEQHGAVAIEAFKVLVGHQFRAGVNCWRKYGMVQAVRLEQDIGAEVTKVEFHLLCSSFVTSGQLQYQIKCARESTKNRCSAKKIKDLFPFRERMSNAMAFTGDAIIDPVRLLIAALAVASSVISFLVQRNLSVLDKRQDEGQAQIVRVRSELAAEAQHEWTRHDAEHTRIHQENEEEHRRIRNDVSANSEDIARLLERTKNR